jgi:serine/threonine protein kinase
MLKKIKGLSYWSLKRVLSEKYKIKEDEASDLADFLLPMLSWYPEKRASAADMLTHPWLKKQSNYDCKLSESEYRKLTLKNKLAAEESDVEFDHNLDEMNESDCERNNADVEDYNSVGDDSTLSDEECTDELNLN